MRKKKILPGWSAYKCNFWVVQPNIMEAWVPCKACFSNICENEAKLDRSSKLFIQWYPRNSNLWVWTFLVEFCLWPFLWLQRLLLRRKCYLWLRPKYLLLSEVKPHWTQPVPDSVSESLARRATGHILCFFFFLLNSPLCHFLQLMHLSIKQNKRKLLWWLTLPSVFNCNICLLVISIPFSRI